MTSRIQLIANKMWDFTEYRRNESGATPEAFQRYWENSRVLLWNIITASHTPTASEMKYLNGKFEQFQEYLPRLKD